MTDWYNPSMAELNARLDNRKEERDRLNKKIDEIVDLVDHAYESWLDDSSDVGTTLRATLEKLEELRKATNI